MSCPDEECDGKPYSYCPQCTRWAIGCTAEIERDAEVTATGGILREEQSSIA